MPKPINPRMDAVRKRLEALVKASPDLAEPAAFYREALPLMIEAERRAEPIAVSFDARNKLSSGLPILVGEDLPLNVEAARELFLKLCRVAERVSPQATEAKKSATGLAKLFKRGRIDAGQLMERAHPSTSSGGDGATLRAAAAEQIRRAVEKDQFDLMRVFAALAMGDVGRVEVEAAGPALDAELLRTLAQNSLKPWFQAWAKQLHVDVSMTHWRRGICPMCGSPPLLSEVQGKEAGRRLRCGMCRASWPYPRLSCAYCGNHDHNSMGRLMIEGEEEKYFVQTCDNCGGYQKFIVTFDPTPDDLLPIEDLATVRYDLIASDHGYARVPVR